MKKITLFFVSVLCMLSAANAQDIIVFNFDGTTPTFDSWSSTFVSVANPVSDGVNASANVGKFTHNAMWSDISIDLTTTPIDSRYCTSFQFKVYSPTEGRLIMGCKNAADTSLSEYNSVQSVTAGWTTITQNIDATQPITKIHFSFKVDTTPIGDATDDIYLDDLIFITKTDATLYSENFTADLAWDADPTVTPSTKIGKWKGEIDLETAGDASITLEQQWAPHDRVLKLTSTDAAVTIPNIDVAGFTDLNLSIDFKNDGVVIAPNIEASVDGGAFSPLTTAVADESGTWETQVITLPAATSTISLRINPPASDPVYFDNFKITGTDESLGTESNQLSDNSIQYYPNPFTKDFNIEAVKSQEPIRVTIFDIMGRKVEAAESLSVSKLLMGSSLKAGLYIVQVEGVNTKSLTSFKILKK